jgi:hypothetical protein
MFDNAVLWYTPSDNGASLLSNPKLSFKMVTDVQTGEVDHYSCKFRGLRLRVYTSSNRVKIKGSLHIFANGGAHNHNQFTFMKLQQTIADVCRMLNMNAEDIEVHGLEFGLNLHPRFGVEGFLKSLVTYKGKQFNLFDPGQEGRRCKMQQYEIKIYNKGLQYGTPVSILRVEVKVNRMAVLNYRIQRLADLLLAENWLHCNKVLLEKLNAIIYRESLDRILLDKENRIYEVGTNSYSWGPEVMDKEQRRVLKMKFNRIIERYGTDKYQSQINDLIDLHFNHLMTN